MQNILEISLYCFKREHKQGCENHDLDLKILSESSVLYNFFYGVKILNETSLVNNYYLNYIFNSKLHSKVKY